MRIVLGVLSADSGTSIEVASRSTSRCAAASATLTIDTVNPTNPDSDQRAALAYIAMMLMVWFILGFALYAVAYAVVGSMVSWQEDVNAAATPITIVVIARYLLAQVTVQDLSGTVATVMSWIPPFSAMLMPLRIAAGTTNTVQIIGSAMLMLLTSAALAVVAARIYERSILRTGKRVSWSDAIRVRE